MADGDNTGKLSIDQAVSLMNGPDPEEKPGATEKAAHETASGEAVPEIESESENQNESQNEQGEAEAEQSEETAAAVRNPPAHWNADEREVFRTLSSEVQDVLLAQEGKRENVLQKAKAEAARAKEEADGKAGEVTKRVAFLDQILPAAAKTFQSRWAGIDWTKLPAEVGAEQAFTLKAQFDNEQRQLFVLAGEQQRAETEQHQNFLRTESEKLRTEAPDLADQKDGAARKKALGEFLVSEGFPANRISLMSAKEASIAYDAMRWRQAEARAKASPKQQAQGASRSAVKPTAAQAQRNTQSNVTALSARLSRTGRIDDAVALLNARSPQSG